jgi:hypothetical protein
MKALAFFPLAYLAGTEGFAMFAAYVSAFLTVLMVLRWWRKSRAVQLRPVTMATQPPIRSADPSSALGGS